MDSRELLAVAMSLPTGDSVVAYTDPDVLISWYDWTEVEGVLSLLV